MTDFREENSTQPQPVNQEPMSAEQQYKNAWKSFDEFQAKIQSFDEPELYQIGPFCMAQLYGFLNSEITKAQAPLQQENERLRAASDRMDVAKRETERHRERANEAQLAWDGHHSHDCAIKCCNEIEEVLGTKDPVEAVKRIRELEGNLLVIGEALMKIDSINVKTQRNEKTDLINEVIEKAEYPTTETIQSIRAESRAAAIGECLKKLEIAPCSSAEEEGAVWAMELLQALLKDGGNNDVQV